MALNINSNISSAHSLNQYNRAYDALTNSIERISTGRRINSAADDASGMSIADSLQSQGLGAGQALKNATDAVSITQIADGALGNISDIIGNIRVKALQASNASQTTESRQAIQAYIDKSLDALDQISETTSFNGQKLLSGDFTNKQFMVDPSSGETVNISINSTESAKLGDFEKGGTLADIDVTTQEGAANAVSIADNALEQVSAQRSDVGSTQNQLTSTINSLSVSRISMFQAESQIRDVDIAEESMNLNKMDLLLKARTFALSQANASKKNIASLLDGI